MPSKYYVVWNGHQKGVFDNWNDCKAQIEGFAGAQYKSFESKQEALHAFTQKPSVYLKPKTAKPLSAKEKAAIGMPIEDSIVVDGAWNTASGMVEYQGVYLKNKQKLFHMGPLQDGTNNIVEFLAIVHALGYCKARNLPLPIYSDSYNAIKWVREKNPKTNHPRNDANRELFDLLDRAVRWLHENTYTNPILKWETEVWGENPADFGRK